jgi:predicted acylesterase/phospholipase RssA
MGCQTHPKPSSPSVAVSSDTVARPPEAAPAPSEKVIPKIGLVLSPGGARTFAELGVLKELIKARVPISAIVGVEWGSLVGALYAQNGQIHEAEWKLYKLETKELTSHSLFGESRPQSIKNLEGFFAENLKGRSLPQAMVRFACPSLSLWSGTFQWQERGEFSDAMKKCLPSSPLLKPSGPWAASLVSGRDAALWLRRQGFNTVIAVNVLRSPDEFDQERMLDDLTLATLIHEVRRSFQNRESFDDVIDIDTKGFRVTDFEKRRELVSIGERLGRPQAEAIASKYGF